eukprot:scaffold6114_cov60-Phaeocystis_antarctica.AAC.4
MPGTLHAGAWPGACVLIAWSTEECGGLWCHLKSAHQHMHSESDCHGTFERIRYTCRGSPVV